MKKFVLLLLLLSQTALAGSYGDYFQQCVLRKNGKFPFEIDQVQSAMLGMYTPENAFATGLHNVVAGVIRGGTRIYDEGRNLVSVVRDGKFIKGKSVRTWTISSIREQIELHKLNEFEKAALVNCAVSSLVDYKRNRDTKLGSILEIYEKGQGICTEMVSIAMDLGRAIGLTVRGVTSKEEHNWPEYEIDGTWYILDPTASGAFFYYSLKQ